MSALALSGVGTQLVAQERSTVADYMRAERFLAANAETMVLGVPGAINWIGESDRFWYRVRTAQGQRFIVVDPVAGSRTEAFDHERLVAALSFAADTAYDPAKPPFSTFRFEDDGGRIAIDIGATGWTCELSGYVCTHRDTDAEAGRHELESPDGTQVAFTKDHDIWVRSLSAADTTRLTTDGEPSWDYATLPEDNTAAVTIRRSGATPPPDALWSPDSKRIATHRLDQRGVLDMHLVQAAPEDGSKRPRHFSYKYALPGDSVVPMAQLVILDAESGEVRRVDSEPVLSAVATPIGFEQSWWSDDGERFYYLRTQRGFASLSLEAVDAATGAVEVLAEETCSTQCDPSHNLGSRNAWVSADGSEVLWFSQRDGWGHLYLLDAATGEVKNRVTEGAWLVRDLIRVDEDARTAWFTAGGREDGDPYFRHLYSVSLEGGPVRHLSPEDADHEISISPSGRYFVDQYSRVDMAPITVVRDRDGRVTQTLEEADLQALFETGWTWPERVKVKARDGVTDLYGVVVRPTDFDPEARYPVIEGVYPGPQTTRVPKRFDATAGGTQSLTELGAVAVLLDGMGTPFRSKAFHDVSYNNLQDAGGLEDHIAGLKQLALSRPYMDLDRVGIYGYSGGGFMSTQAVLRYPDFYKVAVSGAGNHDQRGYVSLWGEKYHGLVDETLDYAQQAAATHADGLEGKLLLIHGEMDDNVSPVLTLQLVDALIKANRTFDMLIVPNRNHGSLGGDPYYTRRQWDYFVEHLMKREPPVNYRIQSTRE